ncbi:MAG TPA: hypothetical protein VMW38_22190 [Terriglobia bacterium]|nr:hypothetical protein [Terriglobia bacterium]
MKLHERGTPFFSMVLRLLTSAIALVAALFCGAIMQGQDSDPAQAKEQLKQKLAAVRQSIAENQKALRQYTWVEDTEVSLKGEVKSKKQANCAFGPDGRVIKTPVGEPKEGGRKGLKGKMVEKKVDELKDYMDRVKSLISRYVPPDSAKMQQAFQAGKAALDRNPEAGKAELAFTNYAKNGDRLALVFDTAARKISTINVNTYLDEPKDTVTLSVRFNTLPDGTSYVEEVLLNATAKETQVKVTNFGYRKAGA